MLSRAIRGFLVNVLGKVGLTPMALGLGLGLGSNLFF